MVHLTWNVVMLNFSNNCLRFARFSTDAAGQRRRTLYKVFGIHFDIMVLERYVSQMLKTSMHK